VTIAFGRYSVSTVSNTQRNGWESAMMKTEASNIHPSKDSIDHEISYSKITPQRRVKFIKINIIL